MRRTRTFLQLVHTNLNDRATDGAADHALVAFQSPMSLPRQVQSFGIKARPFLGLFLKQFGVREIVVEAGCPLLQPDIQFFGLAGDGLEEDAAPVHVPQIG